MEFHRVGTSRPVTNIQNYLRTIAREYKDVLSVVPDGIFGPQTAQSVRSFQTRFNLPPTGTVDNATWDKIIIVLDEVEQKNAPPHPIQVFPAQGQQLVEGQCGDAVCLIQVMFNTIAQSYCNFTALDISGEFCPKTAENVRLLQKTNGCEQTGAVDKTTWNALTRLYHTVHLRNTVEQKQT